MRNVSIHAVRVGKSIEVTVSGILINSLHEATIEDFYPGGGRVYLVDPKAAQIFIKESVLGGSDQCVSPNVPWSRTLSIPDTLHSSVEVFVNGAEVAATSLSSGPFIVIALTADPNSGCSVIPADAMYLAIYSRVFGPGTFEACLAYQAQHCGPKAFTMGEVPFPRGPQTDRQSKSE